MMKSPMQTAINKLTESLHNASSPADVAMLTDKLLAAMEKANEGKERLWNLDDAADYLRLKRETVRRYAMDEMIPHIRINSTTLFEPARLKKWALSQEKQMNRVWRKQS